MSHVAERIAYRVGRFLALVVVVVVGFTGGARAQVAEGTHIPVIINLYANAGTTEAQARDAIKEANKILAQASIHLHVVKVQTPGAPGNGDDGSGGGTAGDGDLTVPEGDKAQDFGGKEVQLLANKRGIKISFTRTPEVGSATPGWSKHRNPTIIVKNRGAAAPTGSTIAHELGHVMTLKPGHDVDGTVANEADPAGHAKNQPGKSGNDNLMAASNRRTGTHLNRPQINEMQKSRFVHGKCSVQFERNFPAEKRKQGHGRMKDNQGDQSFTSSAIYDLDEIVLTTLEPASDINARVTMTGVLPSNDEIDAVYEVAFDIDANASTGVTRAGQPGIDRIARAILAGNRGLGTFSVTGEVENTISGVVTPLPSPPSEFIDERFPDIDGTAVDSATTVEFAIPKVLINLTATLVPAVALAGDGVSVFDFTTEFDFDSARWANDATLTTFGTGIPTPGSSYQFAVSGLQPNAPFDLYVDDTIVMTNTLDGSGSTSGTFIFPSSLSNDTLHFLTAQDSTGEFAYSISCPVVANVPALSGWGVLVLTIALGCAIGLMLRRGAIVSGV